MVDIRRGCSSIRSIWSRLAGRGRGKLSDSLRDPVTGLLSARGFMETLTGCWSQHGVILIVEPDRLDEIRARDGETGAEALLKAVAERLRLCTRQSDVLARVGRGQFAVYLSGAERRHAVRIAHRLAEVIPHRGNPDLAVTLAIGGTETHEGVDPRTALHRAAEASRSPEADGSPRIWPRLAATQGELVGG